MTLKRTGCWMVWKMVPQTDNVTCAVRKTTVCLNTSFESCSPLVNDPPRSARTHAMSQTAAVANRFFLHFMSLGSAVTFSRWSGQICIQLVSSFPRSLYTKNYWNRFIFDRVIPEIKKGDVFCGHSVLYAKFHADRCHCRRDICNRTEKKNSKLNKMCWESYMQL